MENDNLLIGTEFDQNMFGFEAEPLKLILDLLSELTLIKKKIDLKKFNGITDLENKVKAMVG